MCKPHCVGAGGGGQGFTRGYAEAWRLVLVQNDVDGALSCLGKIRPLSQSDFWQWTEFKAALLYHKGDHKGSMAVLSKYSARYPGDCFAAASIRMLESEIDQA